MPAHTHRSYPAVSFDSSPSSILSIVDMDCRQEQRIQARRTPYSSDNPPALNHLDLLPSTPIDQTGWTDSWRFFKVVQAASVILVVAILIVQRVQRRSLSRYWPFTYLFMLFLLFEGASHILTMLDGSSFDEPPFWPLYWCNAVQAVVALLTIIAAIQRARNNLNQPPKGDLEPEPYEQETVPSSISHDSLQTSSELGEILSAFSSVTALIQKNVGGNVFTLCNSVAAQLCLNIQNAVSCGIFIEDNRPNCFSCAGEYSYDLGTADFSWKNIEVGPDPRAISQLMEDGSRVGLTDLSIFKSSHLATTEIFRRSRGACHVSFSLTDSRRGFLVIIFQQKKVRSFSTSARSISSSDPQRECMSVNEGWLLSEISVQLKLALNQILESDKAALRMKEYLQLKDEMESSTKTKLEFLSTISHQIRTPMTAIVGLTCLLRDCVLTKKDETEIPALIQISSQTLLILLRDVVDFSRMQLGCLQFNDTPVELRATLEQSIRSLDYYREAKGLNVSFFLDPSLDSYYMVDRERLGQVTTRFISNAINFTQKGTIVVTLTSRLPPPNPSIGEDRYCFSGFSDKYADDVEDSNKVEIFFSVLDGGGGFSKEKFHRLFQKMPTSRDADSSDLDGLGLGLMIASNIIQKYNGKIWVQSAENKGSIFTFSMKLMPKPNLLVAGPIAIKPQPGGRLVDRDIKELSSATGRKDDSSPSVLSSQIMAESCGPALVISPDAPARATFLNLLLALGINGIGFCNCTDALVHIRQQIMNSYFGFAIVTESAIDQEGMENVVRLRPLVHQCVLVVTSGKRRIGYYSERNLGEIYEPVTSKEILKAIINVSLGRVPATRTDGLGPEQSPQASFVSESRNNTKSETSRMVLIIDSSPIHIRLMQRLLEARTNIAPTSIHIADVGSKALELILSNDYDIVFLDIEMPAMDGLSVMSLIQEHFTTNASRVQPWIVATTTNPTIFDHCQYKDGGYQDMLPKPITLASLTECLERFKEAGDNFGIRIL